MLRRWRLPRRHTCTSYYRNVVCGNKIIKKLGNFMR